MSQDLISNDELVNYVDELFLSNLQVLSSGGNIKEQKILQFLDDNQLDAGRALYELRKCITESSDVICNFHWDTCSSDSLALVLGSSNVGEYILLALDYIQEKVPERHLTELKNNISRFKQYLTQHRKVYATGIRPVNQVQTMVAKGPSSGSNQLVYFIIIFILILIIVYLLFKRK